MKSVTNTKIKAVYDNTKDYICITLMFDEFINLSISPTDDEIKLLSYLFNRLKCFKSAQKRICLANNVYDIVFTFLDDHLDCTFLNKNKNNFLSVNCSIDKQSMLNTIEIIIKHHKYCTNKNIKPNIDLMSESNTINNLGNIPNDRIKRQIDHLNSAKSMIDSKKSKKSTNSTNITDDVINAIVDDEIVDDEIMDDEIVDDEIVDDETVDDETASRTMNVEKICQNIKNPIKIKI